MCGNNNNNNNNNNMGLRPEVPAGTGPMINIQQARDSFLAGIAAHDGDGVSSSGFQRQPRAVPPERKEKSKIQT